MAERTTTRTRPRLGMRPGLMGLIILHVVVILGAIAMFFPFLWTIITSITPGAGLTARSRSGCRRPR